MRREPAAPPPPPPPAWSPSAARERVRALACALERRIEGARGRLKPNHARDLRRRLALLRAFPEIDLLNERAFIRRWNSIAAVGSGKRGDTA